MQWVRLKVESLQIDVVFTFFINIQELVTIQLCRNLNQTLIEDKSEELWSGFIKFCQVQNSQRNVYK